MEYWDIYDNNGNFTGGKLPKGADFQQGEYHIAIEAWLINDKNELLIQKRSPRCEILPGAWALTTGRIVSGEDSFNGCIREIKEELGIDVDKKSITHLARFKRDENHLIWDIYLIKDNSPISALNMQENEVADARWVSIDEFESLIQNRKIFVYSEITDVLDRIKKSLRI